MADSTKSGLLNASNFAGPFAQLSFTPDVLAKLQSSLGIDSTVMSRMVDSMRQEFKKSVAFYTGEKNRVMSSGQHSLADVSGVDIQARKQMQERMKSSAMSFITGSGKAPGSAYIDEAEMTPKQFADINELANIYWRKSNELQKVDISKFPKGSQTRAKVKSDITRLAGGAQNRIVNEEQDAIYIDPRQKVGPKKKVSLKTTVNRAMDSGKYDEEMAAEEEQGFYKMNQRTARRLLYSVGPNGAYGGKQLTKRRILSAEAEDEVEKNLDKYYGEGGEGYDTDVGAKYRKRRKRQIDRENLRDSGRVGRTLHRVGMNSKTAGKIGRVFGKIGAGALIVGAIVAGVKVISAVLNKISEEVIKISSIAQGSLLGTVATGVDTDDQALYSGFSGQLSKATGQNIDINASDRNVATLMGQLVTNTAAAENAIKSAALLDEASGSGGTLSAALDAILHNRGTPAGEDISVLTSAASAEAAFGFLNNRSLWGDKATLSEYTGYTAGLGMDAGELGVILQQLQKSRFDNERGAFLTEMSAAGGDPVKMKEAMDNLRRALSKSGAFLEAIENPLRTETLADHADRFAEEAATFAAVLKTIKEQLILTFGDDLLRILKMFRDALLQFLAMLDKLGIVNISGLDEMIVTLNKERIARDKQSLESTVALPAEMRTAALNTFSAVLPGADRMSQAARQQSLNQEYARFQRGGGTVPAWANKNNTTRMNYLYAMNNMFTAEMAQQANNEFAAAIRESEASFRKDPTKLVGEHGAEMTPAKITYEASQRLADEIARQTQEYESGSSTRRGILGSDGTTFIPGGPGKMFSQLSAANDAGAVYEAFDKIKEVNAAVIKDLPSSGGGYVNPHRNRFEDIRIYVDGEIPGARVTAPPRIRDVSETSGGTSTAFEGAGD